MLTTNQKGAIAEAAIIHEAAKLGIPVLRPTTDERYDIVLDLRGRFVRVQCNWAALQGEVVVSAVVRVGERARDFGTGRTAQTRSTRSPLTAQTSIDPFTYRWMLRERVWQSSSAFHRRGTTSALA
ncbi:MAG: group I intron-associated PD-(D/E)XK endonuclease [Thermoleophilia bacterium]